MQTSRGLTPTKHVEGTFSQSVSEVVLFFIRRKNSSSLDWNDLCF
jgi:hypothetical protein